MKQFHFTIGPVQGFVAQARRTRDFWAGSFLLSWLAGVAMKAVEAHGGTVLFPRVHGNFLDYLEGRQEGEPPRQGSVPNRFRAEVPADFPPAAVEASVRQAFAALAELVWQGDGLGKLGAASTRPIWDRQLRGFWQIAWALADDPSDSAILDRRKNWRSDFPEPEAGVKCTMMEGWQELSGAERPNSSALIGFWDRLRDRTGYDLAPAEHLCSLAFIKRRFVRYFDKLHANMPGGWTLRGWPLQPDVPSVTYVAVAHWLEALLLAKEEAANRQEIHAAALALAEGNPEINRSERDSRIRCVREAARTAGDESAELAILDGRVYFPDSLAAEPDVFPPDKVARLATALKKVDIDVRPSPFYAVLMMDGDSLGRLMAEVDNQTRISDALAEFTAAVPEIVEAENGFLIYAGGDDVLALLPLEDALPCAVRVREAYLGACAAQDIPSTISAAVEFAHMKTPLTKILHDAHSLLDEVAKDRCNRDGLAVRVWKPGGLPVEWALPWEAAAPDGQLLLDRVAASFRARDGSGEAAFTSKLFYKLRDRFELLNPATDAEEKLPGLPDEVAERLLAAEFLSSGVNRELPKEDRLSFEQARAAVRPLLALCRPQTRQLDAGGRATGLVPSDRIEAGGALLARFLVNKGIER